MNETQFRDMLHELIKERLPSYYVSKGENLLYKLMIDSNVPVVLIGHSKLFTRINKINLTQFLNYISNNKNKYYFATFDDFKLDDYRV